MQTLWSDHLPAADKPPSTPPRPTALRSSAAENSPEPPPRSARRLICRKCNYYACPLLTSSPSAKFPNRPYYACRSSSRDHTFFKWADEVSPDELVDVPECGGCKAGPCRVRRETTGPDAGRVLFMCAVKEGDGSCGYRVWQDELQTSAANTNLVEESRQCNVEKDNASTLVDNLQHLQCIEVPSVKREDLKCLQKKPNTYSRSPHKRSRQSDLTDSTLLVQDNTPVSPRDPITLTRSILGIESHNKPPFNPCNSAAISAVEPLRVALDVPSHREIKLNNVMSKTSSSPFSQFAELLQNDLLNRLESMDVKDPEAMSEAAEATFSALDRLLFDGQDFKERVKEFIQCAMSLAEIEQSMPRNNSSHDKLVEKCATERKRLEEINRKQMEVVDTLTNKEKHLNHLREEIAKFTDLLFQLEAEKSCCEVEIKGMKSEKQGLSKEKELSEGNLMIASRALEESEKFRQGKEAAEAALGRARASVRG